MALGLVGCAGAPAPPPERVDDARRPPPTRPAPAPEAAAAEDPIWVGPMPSDDVRRAALTELEELYLETAMTERHRALVVAQLRARFETLANAAARLGVPTMERAARSRYAGQMTEGPSWVEANTPELAPDAPDVHARGRLAA
ncbi:MAG: hypothetical protein M5U28_50850 [Sandaracinaceae bacterium]|nr:hypothetical protein [Sandaracinaceae bacterium]